MNKNESENEEIEIDLLLEAMLMKYGYDFRGYSSASIKRRILHTMAQAECKTISAMQHLLLYNRDFFEKLLTNFSVNVTEMFRDPSFYLSFREHVIPVLKEKDLVKIWHAGCSTGEEVYSMAIVLKEEGIYEKTLVYATDIDENVLKKAKQGIYSIDKIKEYTRNYKSSGGDESFADYYTARYDFAILDQTLKDNVLFSDHNLVTDQVFGEMDVIICRNVLIYFNRKLQDRVFKLFYDSLCYGGILCLGSKESIRFSTQSDNFENVFAKQKIYRKKN